MASKAKGSPKAGGRHEAPTLVKELIWLATNAESEAVADRQSRWLG